MLSRKVLSIGLAAMFSAAGVAMTWAQSGTRTVTPAPRTDASSTRSTQQAPPKLPFDQRLWQFLKAAKYQNWGSLPGASYDMYPGTSPHGDFLKLYVNRVAGAAPEELPSGTLIVKENYGPDKKTLMAVTVMHRSKGFDPEHGDWYWAKYEPNGATSTMEGMTLASKVQMCAECHASAKGDDMCFSND